MDGACSSVAWSLSKDPCGHSWHGKPTPTDLCLVANRSSLETELSRQPLVVRGGCHPRPGYDSDCVESCIVVQVRYVRRKAGRVVDPRGRGLV